ncbi:glutamate--tRNA ligase [Pararhodospirillum photometricum]|uniref:Glutamate--tRNA ligase n=1 Tax=Pararhodospirillum photometricum DSM 122 TaxID=1150469 RepID=H6SSD2_PARPM|nr:glutamate--tRNA ligase [Pararhodospirillum photometricum]CCG07811.1 Glutamyl-tRNA synthetase 2 [Pararhodospirillum photometricum DSM 122]
MTVVTRFAPSPTGFLHIGGARTALFNWLFARHHGGRFLLRIEDTDRARSTPEAVAAILDGLAWMGIDWEGEPVYQFARAARHVEAALSLVEKGLAYRCYCTADELTAMREDLKARGLPPRYDGRWRDRDPADAPVGVAPVIRLKAPQSGETVIDDLVQGTVTVANSQLDDMILLRSDGTPTYMLSVVVDDHDMGITHVIRGDDHLTNAFRQTQLYRALGWEVPRFAHIPLIHGPDGAKLSKRHGALGADAYRDMGFLPEALRNYLTRLGWAHGDAEIFSSDQAAEWFTLDGVGRSPARFDLQKLTALNAHYIREATPATLVAPTVARLESTGLSVDTQGQRRLALGMAGLRDRAKTLVELAQSAAFYVRSIPLPYDAKARAAVTGDGGALLAELRAALAGVETWTRDALEALARTQSESRSVKLGQIAQPIRAALTGSTVSPPVFEVMEVLGQTETLARLDAALAGRWQEAATGQ